jgi:hypothetical protein
MQLAKTDGIANQLNKTIVIKATATISTLFSNPFLSLDISAVNYLHYLVVEKKMTIRIKKIYNVK